jgi:thioredoxin-like negative regulator of GroEL
MFLLFVSLVLSRVVHHVNSIKDWNKLVIASPFVTLVEFKSDKCGSCQEFEPIWTKLTEGITGINFAVVNIDFQDGMC